MQNGTNEKESGAYALVRRLIEERPLRKKAEGRLVLHFDTAGALKKVEDVIPYPLRGGARE
jgi:hypothetical protein